MIYLDNSATTPVAQEVYESMIPYLTTEYGNPSSKYYSLAIQAKQAVENARECVSKFIGARHEEIVFTSGATESTNMIIKGVADYKKYYEKKGNHIITTKVEHKATINTCKFLNGDIYSNSDATFSLEGKPIKVDRGFEVTFLDVNEFGQVEPEMLKNAIKSTTILASVIWGNNEIGTLNDISTLYSVCKGHEVVLHTDATQVIGKLDIDVKKTPVDFMSFSAHKLCGPKGIGAAYVKSDDYGPPPFSAFMHGGEQENGIRASTLAVHNIVGFGKAAEIALRDRDKIQNHYQEMDEVVTSALHKLPFVRILGKPKEKLPGIVSVIIDKPSFNNERFIKKFSDKFAISTGSACTAGQPSHVLQAIGQGNYTGNVLRISIGMSLDKEEVRKAITVLIDLLNKV